MAMGFGKGLDGGGRRWSFACPARRRQNKADIGHTFNVLCLRKHIQGAHAAQFKDTIRTQKVQISREGRRVT